MHFDLDEEHQATRERAATIAERIVAPGARARDVRRVFPRTLVKALAREGVLGLSLPQQWGGAGADHLSMCLMYEEMGRVDSSVRGFLAVHVGLVCQCLVDCGSTEQQSLWLPKLISGDAIGCYCLTEPEAGSDAASVTTRAVQDGNGWVLDGEKHWITNGNVADVALVFATIDPTLKARGVTAFLVPTTSPGFTRAPMPGRELGHRGSDHARIGLAGVTVGHDALLGEPGQGFKIAMNALDHGRLGVAAGAVGVLQACLDACVGFARSRRQFGRRIGDFEMIQAIISDMAADLEAARLLARKAAWVRDQGRTNTQEVSIAKLFATEAAVRAADQAVLLHGARGYSNEYPVERYFRDIKGMQIYEGTSHIQRIIIARYILGRESS